VERSRARPWCGAEGSELLCAKAAASGGEGGSDGRAGVGGGAAAALATGLDASKENGVAALLRLQAIMVATVRQSFSIPRTDLSLLVEFARTSNSVEGPDPPPHRMLCIIIKAIEPFFYVVLSAIFLGVAFVISSPFVVVYENPIFIIKMISI